MRLKRFFKFLSFVVCTILYIYVYIKSKRLDPGLLVAPANKSFLDDYPIELTLRMTSQSKRLVEFFMCDLLRSAVVFWNRKYGDVVIVLDEEDIGKDELIQKLNLSSPFNIRIYYEKPPSDTELMRRLARFYRRSYGYYRMIHSTFYLDLYTTPGSIVALVDSDVIFTLPVVKPIIYRNGKIIVKGVNSFWFSWVQGWSQSTKRALGLPMIADFMSAFPQYVYRSTIRNCREFLLKSLNVRSIEEALIKIAVGEISPINIILSYAYYYERDHYEWHIDLANESLEKYNKKHSIESHELTKHDITPEIHHTVHKPYYRIIVEPLQQALCYASFAFGKDLTECHSFKGKVNWQLFEFQTQLPQTKTWCGGAKKNACIAMINHTYAIISEQYRKHLVGFETKYIHVVEDLALKSRFKIKCSLVNISLH